MKNKSFSLILASFCLVQILVLFWVISNGMSNGGEEAAADYTVSILDIPPDKKLNFHQLSTSPFRPIGNTFATASLPSSFYLRIQIHKKINTEIFYLDVVPDFAKLGWKVYSEDFIEFPSKLNLIDGANILSISQFSQLKSKSVIDDPILYLEINKINSPLITINIVSSSQLNNAYLKKSHNSGIYIGCALCLLLLVFIFNIRYKKASLMVLWLMLFLIILMGMMREPSFLDSVLPGIHSYEKIHIHSLLLYASRCSLSLFLATFLYNFSKNKVLKAIGAMNFVFSGLLFGAVLFLDNFYSVIYPSLNLIINLFLLISTLVLELRKDGNSKWIYLLVWPAIFIGFFILAISLGAIPIPPDINYYDLEWYRIYYAAIFVFILYSLYSTEAQSKALVLREAETKLLATLEHEKVLRQDQEELNKVVSHELKTPLTALYFLIDRLDQMITPYSKQVDSVLKRIKASAQQINAVTDRFSWIARSNFLDEIDLGSRINMLNVANGIIEITGFEDRFEVTSDDHIYVNSNLFCLTTILQNLIDNAIKYSPPNSKIRVNIFKYNDDFLKINVSNYLIKNQDIDLDRIFDKYFRGMGSGGKPGLGLGLWLVKKITAKTGINVDASVEHDQIIFGLTVPYRSSREEL